MAAPLLSPGAAASDPLVRATAALQTAAALKQHALDAAQYRQRLAAVILVEEAEHGQLASALEAEAAALERARAELASAEAFTLRERARVLQLMRGAAQLLATVDGTFAGPEELPVLQAPPAAALQLPPTATQAAVAAAVAAAQEWTLVHDDNLPIEVADVLLTSWQAKAAAATAARDAAAAEAFALSPPPPLPVVSSTPSTAVSPSPLTQPTRRLARSSATAPPSPSKRVSAVPVVATAAPSAHPLHPPASPHPPPAPFVLPPGPSVVEVRASFDLLQQRLAQWARGSPMLVAIAAQSAVAAHVK